MENLDDRWTDLIPRPGGGGVSTNGFVFSPFELVLRIAATRNAGEKGGDSPRQSVLTESERYAEAGEDREDRQGVPQAIAGSRGERRPDRENRSDPGTRRRRPPHVNQLQHGQQQPHG